MTVEELAAITKKEEIWRYCLACECTWLDGPGYWLYWHTETHERIVGAIPKDCPKCEKEQPAHTHR